MNYQKLKKLEKALRNEENPEKGFYTRQQWSIAWKLSEQHTSRKLKQFVENNIMKMKTFRVQCGQFRRMVPHYKAI